MTVIYYFLSKILKTVKQVIFSVPAFSETAWDLALKLSTRWIWQLKRDQYNLETHKKWFGIDKLEGSISCLFGFKLSTDFYIGRKCLSYLR